MSISEKGNLLLQKIKLLTQDEKGSHALVAINKKSTSSQKGTCNMTVSGLKSQRKVWTFKYTPVDLDSKKELIVQLRNSKY